MTSPIDGRTAVPASYAQERLWFLEQLVPGSPAHILSWALRLEGELDEAALRRALAAIVGRHESLRTTFAVVDGRPVQIVSDDVRECLPLVDLGPWPSGERESRLRELIREGERAFDLAAGPLLRACLVRLTRTEHVLLLAMHHVASDAWSMGVLLRELAILYRAFKEGRPSPLPDLPVQYADFAEWQREWLQGERLDRQLRYWKERLDGIPPRLELATDRSRAASPGPREGAAHYFQLSPPAARGVQDLARRAAATPFMVLLAAFQALLQRYTGDDRFVVGTPIANRNHSETEGLIGFFVNLLPLPADLSNDPTFLELLSRVRDEALGAYAHQDLPFEKLVHELAPQRHLDETPLFQVLFALQNASASSLELSGLRVSVLPREITATRYDLELILQQGDAAIAGLLCYQRERFDDGTIRGLARHYRTLVEAALEDPGRRLSELTLLDAEERRRVLDTWNATARPHPEVSLVEQVGEEARRRPTALAVRHGERALSYRDLDRRANGVAWRLRALGLGPESVAAIALERSPELVVAALGILKSRVAYLPLDPAHPAERLDLMMRDAGAQVLLTDAGGSQRLGREGLTIVRMDETLPEAPEAPPVGTADPAELAYVIFTSGSTGRPKGVGVEHRGLANLVAWHRRCYDVGEADRATLIASPGFDASVWEIWPYLTAGACLCVPDDSTRLSAARLASWLHEQAITLTFLPTPLAEEVLEEAPLPGSSLRVLLTGGDRLHRPRREALPFRLVNHYGPTESSVVATSDPVALREAGDPPIGRPIDNTRVYLLDEELRPVPVGVPGHLYIAGRGLARGYVGRPDATAERFLPNPFGSEPGERLYRTGDRARFHEDGRIEFLGRADQQVKVRGFRIELGEVEAALARHPAVREAVVVAASGGAGETRIAAYVATDARPHPSPSELVRFVAATLPAYMVPTSCVVLDALPRNASGKVDRRALPAARPLGDEEALMPPRDGTEQVISAIWAEVLGLERVGIHSNFFDLGGHSLLLARVQERLAAAFPESGLTLLELFRHTTVATLSERVRGTLPAATPTPEAPAAIQRGRERLAQRRALLGGATPTEVGR
jgi:amino acid adenylation domain-containing protein